MDKGTGITDADKGANDGVRGGRDEEAAWDACAPEKGADVQVWTYHGTRAARGTVKMHGDGSLAWRELSGMRATIRPR